MSASYAVASFGGAPSATEQVTVTNSTGQGDAVVVLVGAGQSGSIVSVTDSQGNSYSLIQSTSAQSIGLFAYQAFTNNRLIAGVDWIKVTYAASTPGQQWIARGMSGVSGFDINTVTTSPSSGSISTTTGSPTQAQEWAIALIASAGTGSAPTNFTGGFTAQQTVQNGTGSFYTFADQVTTNTAPLQPGATLAPAVKWELITLSMKFAPVFKIGAANSTGTGSSLTIPVTTPTQPGNGIVVFAKQQSASVTSVTDSTGGNVYTQQQSNTGNSFDVTTHTAQGITQVGAAYSTSSYSDAGGSFTKAGQELDTWLNGGGASWPTTKLSPRTMAYNVLREYYNTDPLMSAASTGWPTSAGSDARNLASKASAGVQNVCITFRPARDGTNNYTAGTYTTEKTNLASAIAYIKSIFPKAKFCLWHEANIFGTNGPFGNASKDPSLGSPYGSTVTTAQMHANWAAYVGFYGPAFQAAGADLYWVNSMASPGEAIDFFDIALNNTQRGYFTGIASDCYTSNFVNSSTGALKTTLTQGYGTNNLSILGLAQKYNLPSSIWELGAGTGQSATNNVTFLDQGITQPLIAWLAQGNAVAEVLWFNYGGDVIGSAMDPSVLAAVQRMYDGLQNVTCALQSGGSITVNWSAGANTKFAVAAGLSLATTGLPDQKVTANSAGSTTPSATTGTLSQANEVVFAYCSDANAGGFVSWAGGWNVLATDQTGSSTFQSLAYQSVSSTSPVTASGTITSAAWDLNVISFPVTSVALTSGMVVPKPKISGTGSVATTSITGTGGMQIPKPRISSGGVGVPNIPYVVGSVAGSGTSLSIPASANVNSGDSIQVGVVLASTASIPTVGPDTAGNTYTQLALVNNFNDATTAVFQCDGANPLVQGVDSIPISQTVSGTFGGIAVGDNGVFASDKVASSSGNTSPIFPNTGTLSQPEEHAIAWIVDAQAGGVPSWGTGWTQLSTVDVNTAAHISVAYELVTATSPPSLSGTTFATSDYAIVLTTNKVPQAAMTNVPSNGVVGVPYRQTLEFTGGQPPVSLSITAGSLPTGLSMSSGVISGIPSVAGSFSFTVTVTDSLSQQTSTAVTVVIASGATGAAVTPMAHNLFAPPDADFEAQGWSWGAQSNASAPFNTQGIAFTGSWCLGWASLADGSTSIAAGAIPVAPNTGYILSGALSPAQSTTAEVGVLWLDINNNPISTQFAASRNVTGAQWCPLAGNFTSPATAVSAVPVVQVDNSNAGDTNFIDMMFFAQAEVQVLVDWTNGAFQPGSTAGNAFMDVSPWLRLDENGVTYTRGRQDAVTEIAAGSGSFELQNDLGQFARDSSVSLPAGFAGSMTLKRRVQLNFTDENGVWYTRFDGNIAEIDYSFDNVGSTSTALINLTDILDDLGRQDPLFCWTKEQVLADGPLYHWSLDDAGTTAASSASGSGVAAETSGNNGPPMRLVLSDSSGTATIGWQDTTGGVETLADAASATGQDGSAFWTAGSNQPNNPLRGLISGNVGPFTTPVGSVIMAPKQTPQSAQNTFIGGTGYMLTAELPTPIAPTATGSDYSIELWMMPDPSLSTGLALNNGPYIALGLGSGTTKTNLLAGIFLNSGAATFKCQTYSQPPSFLGLNWPGATTPTAVASTSAAFTPDSKVKRPHHIVITIQGDPSAATVTLWLDGNQIGSGFTLPNGQTYDTICIGGAYGGCGAFFGNLSLASVYPFMLSQDQITQHCQMGQYGMWEQTTDDCIAQLSTFANIPSFWSNLTAQHASLSLADYMDINGSNALSSMQQYETTEHGLLFVAADGSLQFHSRNWRMGYGAPNLLLPENTFDGKNLQYKVVSQFLCNEEGIAGPNTGGANSTTLLVNPASGPGRTQTQTTASSVIQSGFVNTASQKQYGVYASSPVSSPLTLPLISWSRGYAALGLPASSYWPDPNLSDRAAWDANSRAEPWALPASVPIDLLTLDPKTGLGISDFYNLDIDNVIAPSPNMLPPSFPDAQTSVEWFIEGVTETYTVNSHTLEFYTSPAEPQRAWIPGDAVYGVLGSTARLGVSSADMNAVAADGKSVSHDAGGPYWPPTFATRMNLTSGSPGVIPSQQGGFVGAADIRGIAQNLSTLLQPPLCVAKAQSQVQSFTNGALTGSSTPNIATLYWDSVLIDTTGGMGAIPGWPNWYLVQQAGFYEIDASVTWAATGAQNGYAGQAWIIVAQAAAQALSAGTGTPLTVNQYVAPVGECTKWTASSMTPVCAPTTRMYLGVGDMVNIGAEQNFTAARSTTGTGAGSMFSIRFVGLSTVDDRTLINTSLGTGGSVSLVSHGALQQSNFLNTHTYSYQGKDGSTPYSRLNSDGPCLQGFVKGGNWGSRTSQIAFNLSSIQAALSGHTVLSATITATNRSSYYQNGARMLLGWTKDTLGKSTFNAQDHNSQSWVHAEWFAQNATKTFSIPISIVAALNTGGAKGLIIGNSTNETDPGNYGSWQGGPSVWTLTVNYI